MPQYKNIILYIGPCTSANILAVRDLENHLKRKFRVAFLVRKNSKGTSRDLAKQCDYVLRVDLKNMKQVEKALMPIREKVAAVSCRAVFYMPLYAKLISLFPQLEMPTRDSIEWCSNKLTMRRKFLWNFPEISPKYTLAFGATMDDVARVKRRVGFPCIVKPASLSSSRFVSICYDEEELQATLRRTFRGIKSAYKKLNALVEPEIIVEQFMEGEMYSIDGYVDRKGHVKQLRPVYVKTAQDIGVDDFYGYRHLTPWKLSEAQEKMAYEVGQKAVTALGLRNVTVHMEFKRDDAGWKVLEIDARMGGHRDFLYRESFGILHGMNDLLIRMGERPVIRNKQKTFAVSFNIFAHKTGIIKSIKGLKKVRGLQSLKELIIVKKVGDRVGLSKDGFKKVLDISMSNKFKEKLMSDMRKMEKAIKIEVGRK